MTDFLTILTEYNPIMDLIIIVLLGITLGFDVFPYIKSYLCGFFGTKENSCGCCKETKETNNISKTKETDKKYQEFLNESLAQTPDLIKNMTKSTKTEKPKTTKTTKTKTDKK